MRSRMGVEIIDNRKKQTNKNIQMVYGCRRGSTERSGVVIMRKGIYWMAQLLLDLESRLLCRPPSMGIPPGMAVD